MEKKLTMDNESIDSEAVDTIHKAFDFLDISTIRALLDSNTIEIEDHFIHNILTSSANNTEKRIQLIYMLRNAGCDVNAYNQDGETPLHIATKTNQAAVCEALLRCGAELYRINKKGESVMDSLNNTNDGTLSTDIWQIIQQYMPGLWRAVENDDLNSVRKLVNMWCRVDLKKDSKTLLHLALAKGTEHIIRLIKEIAPTMELAHSVLALDVENISRLFHTDKQLNLEFRNLGDKGATPLYYAIEANSLPIVDLLLEKGSKITTTLSLPSQEADIPLYYTALQGTTRIDILERLTPRYGNSPNVDQFNFMGQHVLFYCIDHNVNQEAVRYIIQQSNGALVALRDQYNITPREYAIDENKMEYVHVIDKTVDEWLETDKQRIQCLSMLGYDLILEDDLQKHVRDFFSAILEGDINQVTELVYYDDGGTTSVCLVDSCLRSDGQPALHTAVLHYQIEIAEILADIWVTKQNRKLDDIRDQCYRTALHYAYGMSDEKQMASMFMQFGASEFAMDKDGRPPLLFKETKDHPLMADLISKHQQKKYSIEEPNPWSDPSTKKIRVICTHHQQELLQNMNDLEYDKTSVSPSSSCTLL